eukprot:358961-Chlamydomonas_euryale.AAC.2
MYATDVAARRIEAAARQAREAASLSLLRELEAEAAAGGGGGRAGGGGGGGGAAGKKKAGAKVWRGARRGSRLWRARCDPITHDVGCHMVEQEAWTTPGGEPQRQLRRGAGAVWEAMDARQGAI